MAASRQWVLAGLLAVVGVLTTAVLFNVLSTVFFAITVAYVLVPLHKRLVDRGLPPWWASAVASTVAFSGVVALFGSLGFLLYRRRNALLGNLSALPDSVSVELFGVVYAVDASTFVGFAREYLTDVAISMASVLPILAIKATLFALLVFALLIQRRRVRTALLAPVPPAYRDVVAAFHERTRSTLSAIYVLQAATAAATFLVALPVFYALGYDLFVTFALVAGFLQFIPVVGPSFLLALLAVGRATAGEMVPAALLIVVGGVVIGWLPDAVVRPRLARKTADLPGSLYFVGFTGGLLSIGPVGFIAGPLVVALLAEATKLLAAEVNRPEQGSLESPPKVR